MSITNIGQILQYKIDITADTTLSDYTSAVKVLDGGGFNIATGITLTVDIPFTAESSPVFTGNGSVVFKSGSVREVYPEWFGENSIPGTTDMSTALQKATNTGQPVKLTGTYFMSTGVTYTGKVVWRGNGNAKILCDSTVITVSSGSYSEIDNIYLENVTAPYIITRTPPTWSAVMTAVQSNGPGYQPTVNDTDCWSSFSSAIQNQNVGPNIVFQEDASYITVSNITGRFVSIMMYDTQYSTVRDCTIRAGKGINGGIGFWNVNHQVGQFNKAIHNHISYASFNGIVFARNYDGVVDCNTIEYCGESGIKTYQNTIGGIDYRCYRMLITNNYTRYAYYDGFDFSVDYPHTATVDNRSTFIGNQAFGCRLTGFYGDGQNNVFKDNWARSCGKSGIKLDYAYSDVSGNYVYGCNTSDATSGEHQIVVVGDYNAIHGNFIKRATATQGYNYYISGNSIFGMNYEVGSTNSYLGPTVTRRTDDDYLKATAGVVTTHSGDLSAISKTGLYFNNNASDRPDGNWYFVLHFYLDPSTSKQIAFSYATNSIRTRYKNNGIWGGWATITVT